MGALLVWLGSIETTNTFAVFVPATSPTIICTTPEQPESADSTQLTVGDGTLSDQASRGSITTVVAGTLLYLKYLAPFTVTDTFCVVQYILISLLFTPKQ